MKNTVLNLESILLGKKIVKKRVIFPIFGLLVSLFPQYVWAQPIERINISGATIFSAEIDSLTASYLNQEFELQRLKELTTAITNLYLKQGYITSGAFLPKQEIVEGIVNIYVVEGRLEQIEIEGLKRLKKSYINSHLKAASQGVFNINKLKEALESLQIDPWIENVQGELVSGTSPETSILWLKIKEAPVFKSSFTVNNWASPTIGEVRGVVKLNHQNLLGKRDRAFAQYDVTGGSSTYELKYTIPLNYRGTAISVGYRNGDSKIIEEPFDAVDISAEADSFSVELIQELARSTTTVSRVSLIFERIASNTSLRSEPFSFTSGPQDGRSRLSVFRVKGDWLKRFDLNVLSLRSQLSLGVDLFDVTINENDPDGLFLSWFGQLQWGKALNKEQNIVLITRLVAQLTPNSLLPLEQFSLGGATTVRGYRYNYLFGDNGVVVNLEVAFTLLDDSDWGQFKLIPFFDLGRVWDTDDALRQSLASVGLGIDWQLRESISLRFDFALPLTDVEDRGNSLSDSGISFSLQFNP